MTGIHDIFTRNIMLYGNEAFERLQKSQVTVAGLGGVGGYAAEILVRAGVGRLRIIDCDVVKPTDINRQLTALSTNFQAPKVDIMEERLRSINPSLRLDACRAFFHSDTAETLITPDMDFVVDAIDSLGPKGELIRRCKECCIPVISAMGAAGRTDPFRVRIGPLDDTVNCRLARALRRHLRSRGIGTDIQVVYSTEPPVKAREEIQSTVETAGTYTRGRPRRSLPSLPTIPAIFGILAAHHVLSTLIDLSARD